MSPRLIRSGGPRSIGLPSFRGTALGRASKNHQSAHFTMDDHSSLTSSVASFGFAKLVKASKGSLFPFRATELALVEVPLTVGFQPNEHQFGAVQSINASIWRRRLRRGQSWSGKGWRPDRGHELSFHLLQIIVFVCYPVGVKGDSLELCFYFLPGLRQMEVSLDLQTSFPLV